MKRGLLISNPTATSVSPQVRDVIAHALASELELELETAGTKRRHHATHIARGAVHEGFDVVICLGGDGTLNEVINGLAGSTVPVVPLPGGGTNVFARSLGLPRDPIAATAVILERIASDAKPVRIPLGRINDRYFAFCAGVGFDAAVVRNVERTPRMKRRFGDAWFIAQALRTFYVGYGRRASRAVLRAPNRTIGSVLQTIICNTDPYTYLGSRPFRLCPHASLLDGLDAMTADQLRTISTLRLVFRAFGRARHDRLAIVQTLHDASSFTIESRDPVPFQVDGDYCGTERWFDVTSEPDALSVLF